VTFNQKKTGQRYCGRGCGKKRHEGYPSYYPLDLALPRLRLSVEVDGNKHHDQQQQRVDGKKEAFLAEAGWTVLRLWNKDIRNSLATLVAKIRSRCMTLESQATLPSP
jgi:very-short-patch-repair endonuclease